VHRAEYAPPVGRDLSLTFVTDARWCRSAPRRQCSPRHVFPDFRKPCTTENPGLATVGIHILCTGEASWVFIPKLLKVIRYPFPAPLSGYVSYNTPIQLVAHARLPPMLLSIWTSAFFESSAFWTYSSSVSHLRPYHHIQLAWPELSRSTNERGIALRAQRGYQQKVRIGNIP
jgi:hypothetical protein